MTVGYMLKNMNQKELCHWMAYFRIESEEYEARKEEIKAKGKAKQPDDEQAEQNKKDGALFAQLMMLAGKDESFFENK